MIELDKNHKIIGTDVLDHHGLVAATINKLGISKKIDEIIPLTSRSITSMGQRVTAMIHNALGFIDDRLYMFPKFLMNKPVSKLFDSSDMKAEYFNDDALGRCLDAIHEYGETKFFSEIAIKTAIQFNMLHHNIHLDTTTLSLYGSYENCEIKDCEKQNEINEIDTKQAKCIEDKTAIKAGNKDKNYVRNIDTLEVAEPKFGYAKNKRFDLKQMTLLLGTTGASGFPIWMESHSGNASDKKKLEEAAQRMQKFCKALNSAPNFLFVGDSAIYSNCVKYGQNLLWLTRVPENLKNAKKLLCAPITDWNDLPDGYKMHAASKEYSGNEQRWVLIYSKQAKAKELATLNKNIDLEMTKTTKLLWHLSNKMFGCKADLHKELKEIEKKLKYHLINLTIETIERYSKKGTPKEGENPDLKFYKAVASIAKSDDLITNCKQKKGKFILATNQLDENKFKAEDFLESYKKQSTTEGGFKFIKDGTFEVDSVFLKKPGRISALMVIMTFTLMVYSYAQFILRQQLINLKQTIPSQTGRQIDNPSMKWVYRMFHGVHILKMKINNVEQDFVLNMTDLLRRIVTYFGDIACKIYGILPQ